MKMHLSSAVLFTVWLLVTIGLCTSAVVASHDNDDSPPLASLRDLQIDNDNCNHFTGTIPPGIGDWILEEDLVLDGNHLIGEIPQELSELLNSGNDDGTGRNESLGRMVAVRENEEDEEWCPPQFYPCWWFVPITRVVEDNKTIAPTYSISYVATGLPPNCTQCKVAIYDAEDCSESAIVNATILRDLTVDDPYDGVGYTSGACGNAAGNFSVYDGLGWEAHLGKATVFSDEDGNPVACGILMNITAAHGGDDSSGGASHFRVTMLAIVTMASASL
ncbi:MAG: hypothetical protein SGARI_006377, partial [Bacillariaceae sp.]